MKPIVTIIPTNTGVKKVIFYEDYSETVFGALMSARQMTLFYDKIDSISLTPATGFLGEGQIVINTSTMPMAPLKFTKKFNEEAAQSVKHIQTKIDSRRSSMATAPPPSSVADELMKFKQMLDAGIITQEEFDAKKKQLLG